MHKWLILTCLKVVVLVTCVELWLVATRSNLFLASAVNVGFFSLYKVQFLLSIVLFHDRKM